MISLSFRRLPFGSYSYFLFLAIDGGSCCGLTLLISEPNGEGLARQITEAFPWDMAPKYLIRDNFRSDSPGIPILLWRPGLPDDACDGWVACGRFWLSDYESCGFISPRIRLTNSR